MHRTYLSLFLCFFVCGCVAGLETRDDAGVMDAAIDDASSDGNTTEDAASDGDPEDSSMGEDASGEDAAAGEDAGVIEAEFEEVDGQVVFEAENYFEQVRDEWTRWYAFQDGAAEPDVMCRTNVSCGGGAAPDCNPYGDCDGDDIDPAEASGGTYLEALPDRRRDDSEAGTGGEIGVVNDPNRGPMLTYRVHFSNPGRYYVWIHARGQGPAANGLHVGLDGMWPENDLIDPSSMRMQFRNGWNWTQTRRGGRMHTGVSAGDGVSLRDANIWLQIETAGVHTIHLSMREDGLEIDKVILSSDAEFEPTGIDQPETRASR